MKTFFSTLIFCFITSSLLSQDQKTAIEGIAVVTIPGGSLAAQLSWKKGDENVAYFIVERSTDGVDFKQCATVFLNDDPSLTDYKFKDKIPVNSHGLLYRVGIVNEYRRVSYLPIRKVISPDTL